LREPAEEDKADFRRTVEAEDRAFRDISAGYRNIVGLLTRSLGAASEFFKTLRYRAVIQATLPRGRTRRGYLSEARGLIDGRMKNLPGFAEMLPRTHDVFGEPMWRRIGIASRDHADEVEAEHNRIILETGRGIGKPDPTFHGVNLRDITLENGRNAYGRLQELSGELSGVPSLKERLATLIRSETYQALPDGESSVSGTRLNAWARMVAKYREVGRKALLWEAPELRSLIAVRQQVAEGAYLESKARRSSSGPGARELLEALRGERGL
jgi:hypothetical protein